MNVTDIISIVNIVVTATIGIWIASSVNKKLSSDRAIKDYFIQEAKENQKLYADFFNQVFKGSLSAKDIKDWLKIMSNRMKCLEGSLSGCFDIKKEDITLQDLHSRIQSQITSLDDFNEQYKNNRVIFGDNSKRVILEYHITTINEFNNLVVRINMSTGKRKFR